MPTFEINVCVKFDRRRTRKFKCLQFFLSRVEFLSRDKRKKILTQDKKLPTFENNVCVKFDSRQRKKFPTFFLSSHVKFYANVNLKCRHFLSWVKHKKPSSRVGNFKFPTLRIMINFLRKIWQEMKEKISDS